MNRDIDIIVDEAATWHAGSFGDEMDWDGFTAWLEADPRHRAAYDEVALADALALDHAPQLPPVAANDGADDGAADHAPASVVRFAHWRRWAGAAIAASLVAVLAVPQFLATPGVVYQTGAETRTVALEDGSRIIVAPHSRLEVSGRHQDALALNGGAWFDIRHDPDRAMTITAGGVAISDIGTSFDIQANAGDVRIEVAQGEVSVTSDRLNAPVRLQRGRALTFDGKAGTATVAAFDVGDAGEWRSGRLTYQQAPLALVADDLGRYGGVSVTVPRALAGRQFSGTLVTGNGVTGNGEAALRDLSQLMGLGLDRDGRGYRLSERR